MSGWIRVALALLSLDLRAPQLGGAPLTNAVVTLGIPDLDPVVGTGHDYSCAYIETAELTKRRLDIDPTLRIDGDLEGVVGEHAPCISAHLAPFHFFVRFSCHELEVLTGVHVDAPVTAEGKKARRFEPGPKRRRQGYTALRIELTLVPTDEQLGSSPHVLPHGVVPHVAPR